MPIKTRIDMLATGIKTPVGVKIAGPDLATIQKIGEDLERIIEEVPGTASVYSERVSGGRYLTIDINRVEAARFGLNIRDVQDVLAMAVGGVTIGLSVEGLERYPINIRYPQEYRDSVESLRALPIVTPSGLVLALADVAAIRIEDGPPGIKSENARINGWTFIDIKDVDVGTYVENAIQMVDDRLQIPPGYSIKWSGQYEYMVRAKERLSLLGPLTVLIIALLLYANFRRPQEVLILLGTLPLSLIGGVWLLYLYDYNISVAVGVGFIALAGVSIEIGMIVLVYLNDSYQASMQAAKGLDRKRLIGVIVEGAGRRIRPVIMTVAATIVGLLPILFGSGTGSEVMTRMAAPMVGGMLSAFVLTMLVLPVIFLEWKAFGINDGE